MNDEEGNDDRFVKAVAAKISRVVGEHFEFGPSVPMLSMILCWQISAAMAEEALRVEHPDQTQRYLKLKEELLREASETMAGIVEEERVANQRKN